MRSMYEQQLFTDATLVVQGQKLHAHRAVLAAASPVFLRMFSSPMQEGEQEVSCMHDAHELQLPTAPTLRHCIILY